MKLGCITGMHRSGTSVAANILHDLGVDLGPEDHFLPTRPDNPKGYFENRDVTRCNDAFLRHLGCEWHSPPHLAPGWEHRDDLSEFRNRASGIVAATFSGPISAMKDPRLAITLPLWRTVVAISPVVVMVRHPVEVAASLERRDGLAREHAAALWLRYTVDAWSNDTAPVVVAFDDLYRRADDVADRLARAFGLQDAADPSARIADTIDADLRHHHGPTVDHPGPLLRDAIEFFDAVLAGRSDEIGALADRHRRRWSA